MSTTNSANPVKPEPPAAAVAAPAGAAAAAKASSPLGAMMPTKSMYAPEGAAPCDIYRSRNGIVMVKGGIDDDMANSGGMYVNKAAINAQTFGAPACGKAVGGSGASSSCGSISAMIAKLQDSEIAAMSPSERNRVDSFSSRSIARLARSKEQKDEAAAVEKTSAEAEKTKEPVKVAAMMDDLKKKSETEAADIVKTEEQVKRDFLGRPCPPGSYKQRSEAMAKQQLKVAGAELSLAIPALMPQPMFASLRETDKQPAGAAATVAGAADAGAAAGAAAGTAAAAPSNLARADEKAASATEAGAVASAQGVSTDNAGPSPIAEAFKLGPWAIAGLVLLSLLVLLAIAGVIYWLVGGGKEGAPKGRIMRTVAAAGGLIGKGVTAVTDTAKGVFQAGKTALSKTAEGIVSAGEKTIDTAAGVAGGALDVGKSAIGTVAETGGALLRADLPGAAEALGGGLKATAQTAVGTVKEAVGDVADVAGSALRTVGEVGGAAVDAGAAVVGGATDLAKGAVTGTVDVARAAVGADESSGDAPADASTSSADAGASDASSVGMADIDQAFDAAPAKDAAATEDLQAKTADIVKEAEQALAADSSSDLGAGVADTQSALGDVAK